MDQSDCSIGVYYFLIFPPGTGILVGCALRIPVVAIERVWILVETRVNKDRYFVVLTYPS